MLRLHEMKCMYRRDTPSSTASGTASGTASIAASGTAAPAACVPAEEEPAVPQAAPALPSLFLTRGVIRGHIGM